MPIIPVIIPPVIGGTSGVNLTPVIHASSFNVSNGTGTYTHVLTNWEVRTGDNGGGILVWSYEGGDPNLTVSPQVSGLTNLSTYYARVRYKELTLGYSEWSPDAEFNTIAEDITTPINSSIITPSIVTPESGTIGMSLTPTLTSSVFTVANNGVDTHESTDWEIRTRSNGGGVRVWNVDAATGVEMTEIEASGLSNSTTYYARVRYKGVLLGYSNWSDDTILGTLAVTGGVGGITNKPYIIIPSNGVTNVSTTPNIASSTFGTTNINSTHLCTDWEIRDAASESGRLLYYNYADTNNLTTVTVPARPFPLPLPGNSVCYVRVRYRGVATSYSEWSDWSSFSTVEGPSITLIQNHTNLVGTHNVLYPKVIDLAIHRKNLDADRQIDTIRCGDEVPALVGAYNNSFGQMFPIGPFNRTPTTISATETVEHMFYVWIPTHQDRMSLTLPNVIQPFVTSSTLRYNHGYGDLYEAKLSYQRHGPPGYPVNNVALWFPYQDINRHDVVSNKLITNITVEPGIANTSYLISYGSLSLGFMDRVQHGIASEYQYYSTANNVVSIYGGWWDTFAILSLNNWLSNGLRPWPPLPTQESMFYGGEDSGPYGRLHRDTQGRFYVYVDPLSGFDPGYVYPIVMGSETMYRADIINGDISWTWIGTWAHNNLPAVGNPNMPIVVTTTEHTPSGPSNSGHRAIYGQVHVSSELPDGIYQWEVDITVGGVYEKVTIYIIYYPSITTFDKQFMVQDHADITGYPIGTAGFFINDKASWVYYR